MSAIYYSDNLGNSSNSDGFNDFLLAGSLSYYNSLANFKDKYVPYYIRHNSTNEWEIGLGIVITSVGQDVLVRSGNILYPETKVYASSNNNQLVNFSAGSKQVTLLISAERINHGGNNYVYKNSNFVADTVQSTYGVLATGTVVNCQLPLASGNKNLVLSFRLFDTSNNNLVINASGIDSIDSASSSVLTPQLKYTTIISDGSGWYSLNREPDVDSSGFPQGVVGSIQYKASTTEFGGNSNFKWNDSTQVLYIGGANIAAASGIDTVFNSGQHDVNFRVRGTGNNELFFDAAAGRLGVNTSSPATILHIIGQCSNETMRLDSTTSCPTGVALTLFHNPSNGSDVGDYPATINLAGRNSNAQKINYAQIRSRILGTQIGSTSGELIFNVDYLGVPTTVVTANPKKITIGLNGQSRDTNNILIGSNVKNSGSNNILIGHDAVCSGILSSGNLIFGNNVYYSGSNSVVSSHNSSVSGDRHHVFGRLNIVNGSDNSVFGVSSTVSGAYNASYGYNNILSGTQSYIIGSNNNSQNSGIGIGYSNILSGINNISVGSNAVISGQNNALIGRSSTISGIDNYSIGYDDNINGSGNIIIGSGLSCSGLSSILIGKNISSTQSDLLILGIDSQDIVISSTAMVFNSGLGSLETNIFGNNIGSGLFYRNNKLGINIVPTGDNTLQVNGSIRSDSFHTDSLRLGSVSATNSVLVSDSLGNASWQNPGVLQSGITANLTSGLMVTYNGSGLVSTSNLNWNSSSGVIFTQNSNIVIPTNNTNPFIVNGTQNAITNAFNIRGSGNANLFVANASSNTIGINVANPQYSLHASGTARIFKDTLYFLEKNDNQFILAYDIGPGSPNRLSITSSGIIINQTIAGTIFPEQTYVGSPTVATTENILLTVWDTNDNRLKYTEVLAAGFETFNGTSDS